MRSAPQIDAVYNRLWFLPPDPPLAQMYSKFWVTHHQLDWASLEADVLRSTVGDVAPHRDGLLAAVSVASVEVRCDTGACVGTCGGR